MTDDRKDEKRVVETVELTPEQEAMVERTRKELDEAKKDPIFQIKRWREKTGFPDRHYPRRRIGATGRR